MTSVNNLCTACTGCDWLGNRLETVFDDTEQAFGCPNCRTDEWLVASEWLEVLTTLSAIHVFHYTVYKLFTFDDAQRMEEVQEVDTFLEAIYNRKRLFHSEERYQ